jgi:hypothetical protein
VAVYRDTYFKPTKTRELAVMQMNSPSIAGYTDYQRREYCRDIDCPRQKELESKPSGSQEYEEIRNKCKNECLHTTYEFHHWLIGKGYLIVRPE